MVTNQTTYTVDDIRQMLYQVFDPEIPTISVVDLGVITNISIDDMGVVSVEMTPTFVGCPAIDVMKNGVIEVLLKHGIEHPIVTVSFDTPWDSNRVTEQGKKILKEFGLAPPPKYDLVFELDILHKVSCPFCDSENTVLQTPFGPTLCRSIHYCNNCSQAFEQFKPL